MKKSIIIQELLSKQQCQIEKKEGEIYLNENNITNHVEELLKILSQSIIMIAKNEIKIDNLLSSFLEKKSYSCRKIGDIKSEKNEDISNNNAEKEKIIVENNLSQEILDQITYQNQPCKKTSNQFQDILDQYVNIVCKITEDAFNLSFQSPFLLPKQVNFTKIEGQISKCETLYYYCCNLCDSYSGGSPVFMQDNKQISDIGKYIFEKVVINVDITPCCNHESDRYYDAGQIPIDYVVNIQSEENIKFEEIEFSYSQFVICKGFKREINITQDQYLKKIVISLHLLQYVKFTQDEGRFLQILHLIPASFNVMRNENYQYQMIHDKLKNVKFSELWIDDDCISYNNQDELNSLNYLTFFRERTQSKSDNDLYQIIQIFNRKYANTLILFAFDKLFGQDFSFLRVMFDLHEFDYQLPVSPQNISQQQRKEDQKKQGNQKNIKAKKKTTKKTTKKQK